MVQKRFGRGVVVHRLSKNSLAGNSGPWIPKQA